MTSIQETVKRPILNEPPSFGRQAVILHNSVEPWGLHVELMEQTFILPRRDVGDPVNPTIIFNLDIKKNNDRELYNAAVEWFAQEIVSRKVETMIIPPSKKSTDCLREAVKRAQDRINNEAKMADQLPYNIRLIELVGGENEEDIRDADPNLWLEYFPITRREGKYIGMKTADAEYLHERFSLSKRALRSHPRLDWLNTYPGSEGIFLADDVYSSGATVDAMKMLVARVMENSQIPSAALEQQITTLVLAVESTEPFPTMSQGLVAAMRIVELPSTQ